MLDCQSVIDSSITEQRINIKFRARLGETAIETLHRPMLNQVYGDHCQKKSNVFEWHRRFKEGREDDTRPLLPVFCRKDENEHRVQVLVKTDRRLSVKMLADEHNLRRETVRKILTEDLHMRKIFAEMVPNLLTEHRRDVFKSRMKFSLVSKKRILLQEFSMLPQFCMLLQ